VVRRLGVLELIYNPFTVPIRTPMYDPAGRLAKPWVDYLTEVATKSGRSALWRGTWRENLQYAVCDVVRHEEDSSIWIALQATPIQGEPVEPGRDATVWEFLFQPVPPGGGEDQVLAKASGDDFDVEWVDSASASMKAGVLGVVIDGAGSVPSVGPKGFIQVPYDGTVTGWTMLADQVGDAAIDVKKCSYDDFPTTVSIVAAAPPTLAAEQKATSEEVGDWDVELVMGDVLEFNLDSVATVQRVILEIYVVKATAT
jgi:hypothetical protein